MNILNRLAALWAGVVLFVVTFPARLVGLLGLVLVLTLAGWKISGQSFGSFSADQPFLAADAAAEDIVDPAGTTNLIFWWVASDVTNGTVNEWTNRLDGSYKLVNSSNAPSANGTYVTFDGTTRLWFSPKLYYGSLNTTNMGLAVIFSHNQNLSAFTGELLDGTNVQVVSVLNTSILRYRAVNVAAVAPGVLVDYVHNTDGFSYTNTVLTGGGAAFDATPPDLTQVSGFNRFQGKLYEILIWSNAPGVSKLNSANISNLHYYATNTYGFSP